MATNITAVKLNIDIVRYNKALNKEEKGTNDEREDDLLRRFPPAAQVTLDMPAIVVDNGGRYLLWYLPNGISGFFQVFCTQFYLGHTYTDATFLRQTCFQQPLICAMNWKGALPIADLS